MALTQKTEISQMHNQKQNRGGLHLLSTALIPMLVAFALAPQALAKDAATSSLDGSEWRIAPQAEVKEDGNQLSTAGFAPQGWLAAQVPGTVFNAYVLAGREKVPTTSTKSISASTIKTSGIAPSLPFRQIIKAVISG
jgi:hypothetical protein